MKMRSAVLRTADHVDIYVPNQPLLTTTVADYTHMKQAPRKTLNVGVSYDSDPIKVRDTLQEVIESHGLVLKDPPPAVFFTGFGSFTLDFEIAVWIADPGRAAQVLSDLHFMIYREFTKRGIEIPIPQQDFRLRSDQSSTIEQLLTPPLPENGAKNGTDARKNNPDTTALPSPKAADAVSNDLPPERVKAPSEKPKLPG
jgi:small-conductance mechanosensitive channel